MNNVNRKLMRIAVAVAEQLSEHSSVSLVMPSGQFQRCEKLIRQLNVARHRSWYAAASQMDDRLRVVISELTASLQSVAAGTATQDFSLPVYSVRHIYDDLISLCDEFEDVQTDFKSRQLSVVTEAIELEDVFLGRFKIQVDWNDLRDGHPVNYRVIALDPVHAASNDSVTHPHVQDESLCEGDGHLPIVNALRQGRLYDFFVIVRNLLRTYNSGSPYVALSDWYGAECGACGCSICEDDLRSCESCDVALCSECYECCESCSGSFCSECTSSCECCGDYRCRQCLDSCSTCDCATCQGCLENNERCSDCYEKEKSETAGNDAATGRGTTATLSAVHANSVG